MMKLVKWIGYFVLVGLLLTAVKIVFYGFSYIGKMWGGLFSK